MAAPPPSSTSDPIALAMNVWATSLFTGASSATRSRAPSEVGYEGEIVVLGQQATRDSAAHHDNKCECWGQA